MTELRYQLDLLKAMNQKLNDKEQMYRFICDTSEAAYLYYSFARNEFFTLGIWSDFFDFKITNVKELLQFLEEADEADVIPLREALFIEKSGQAKSAFVFKQKNKEIWLEVKCHVEYDNGQPVNKLIRVKNITEQKYKNDSLKRMAYYDELTGLYNRNYFLKLLEKYVEKARDNNAVVSMIMIDIIDFIKVKDMVGITFGDEVLQLLADFLKEFSSDNVIVGHLENDYFGIAVYNPVKNVNDAEYIVSAIDKRLKKPFYASNGKTINYAVCMGVAEFPEAAITAQELINYAEIVIYKGRGKKYNNVTYFNTHMLNDFLYAIEIENKLHEAVKENDFILHFQPQYYSGSKVLRGMEALVRWKERDGSIINPGTFIPIAERNGAILTIGQWVVHESIKTYARWKQRYGVKFILSINISALQYKDKGFVDDLMNTVRRYNINPEEIELEITESILIDDFASIIDKLKVLKDCGIRIALDDFGTGFSSLSYLKKLPINTLKIDKSFVDTIMKDSATRVITETIINMVKALGFESIAEGVEKEEQYQYLDAIGCNMIQGFLLGKPMPVEDVEAMFINM